MANLPKYNTRNFSFGPGVLYLSLYDVANDMPTYPAIDVGAVRPNSVLRINRETLDVMQGSPEVIVKSYVIRENIEFQIASIEWNLENFYRALGGGILSSDKKTFSFGGDMESVLYTLRFVHEMPSGDLIEVRLWKANPAGSLEISFANDNVHEFQMTFKALPSQYGFDTASKSLSTGSTDTVSGTLDNTPVLKNSVKVYLEGVFAGEDDGQGNITGPLLAATGSTINYNTGAITIKFAQAPGSGKTVKIDYAYSIELSGRGRIVQIKKFVSS